MWSGGPRSGPDPKGPSEQRAAKRSDPAQRGTAQKKLLKMSIQTEVWVRDITQNLFPSNSFLQASRNDTGFVVDGKVVHLPQVGAAPGVVVNRSAFPAGASQRTDTDSTYNLDSYTSDPTHIRDLEIIEASYDKRMSVLEDHIGSINDSLAYGVAVGWAATQANRIIRTTGDNRPAMSPGATGNRKKILVADFLAAKRVLDKDNVPSENRYVLLPSEMYNDLLTLSEVLAWDKMGTANLPTGAIGRLLGFNIYIRSEALIFNNAANPVVKALGQAAHSSDNAGALFWHKDFVRRALGEVKLFMKDNDPQFYGSVMSAEVRAGGRRARADEKGVVCLVEAHGA